MRILQFKSVSPETGVRTSDERNNRRNLTVKLAAKKAKLFGASFTMKLWNKGNNSLSNSEGGTQSEI